MQEKKTREKNKRKKQEKLTEETKKRNLKVK